MLSFLNDLPRMFVILNKNGSSIFICIHRHDDEGFEIYDLPKSKKIKSWFKPPSSASATYTASTIATSTASTISTVATDSTIANSSSESAVSTNPLLIPDTAEICSNINDNKLYANRP